MNIFDGNAIIYCEGAFNTPNGKTTHDIIHFAKRYKVISVIDSVYAGKDAGKVLDGVKSNIPIFASLNEAFIYAEKHDQKPEYAIVGLVTNEENFPEKAKVFVKNAIVLGLHVDSELHQYLMKDDNIIRLAVRHGVRIRDIRKLALSEQ